LFKSYIKDNRQSKEKDRQTIKALMKENKQLLKFAEIKLSMNDDEANSFATGTKTTKPLSASTRTAKTSFGSSFTLEEDRYQSESIMPMIDNSLRSSKTQDAMTRNYLHSIQKQKFKLLGTSSSDWTIEDEDSEEPRITQGEEEQDCFNKAADEDCCLKDPQVVPAIVGSKSAQLLVEFGGEKASFPHQHSCQTVARQLSRSLTDRNTGNDLLLVDFGETANCRTRTNVRRWGSCVKICHRMERKR